MAAGEVVIDQVQLNTMGFCSCQLIRYKILRNMRVADKDLAAKVRGANNVILKIKRW